MVDLKALQKAVYDNKVAHGWNVTDMCREFCQMESEVSEAFQAYFNEPRENFAEELADVVIYALGMAEIAGVDLERALLQKIEKNRRRRYRQREDGSWEKIEGEEQGTGDREQETETGDREQE